MSDRIVRVMCPNLTCRTILAVPVEARGRMVRCKQCASNILIPRAKSAVGTAPKPADPPKDAAQKKAG